MPLERVTLGEQRKGNGTPLAHGLCWANLGQQLFQRLELLSLLPVHSEEVAGKDKLPNHVHGHGHEDVSPPDSVVEISVDVRAIQDGIVKAVDDLLIVDLACQAAGPHVGEFGKAQNPLLDVGTELLAAMVKVVLVLDVEELHIGSLGLENLTLQLANLFLGGI